MSKFNIINDIWIDIPDWKCCECSSINNKHYYYCNVCKTENDKFNIINCNNEYKIENKKEKVMKVFNNSKIITITLSCYNFEHFQKNIINIYPLFEKKIIGGIWITSSNNNYDVICDTIILVKEMYPTFWVGINLVGENIITVLKFINKYKPDGIWNDNSYITDKDYQNIPELIIDQFKKYNWNGLYFGGTLFKYITYEGDINKILENSYKYMDVVTTSGDGTGIEINNEKLINVYNLVAKNSLIAVASGISSTNIKKISKYCNIFLVGTSVTDQDYNVIVDKVIELYNELYY
jgi:hypothetical protein